MQWTVDILPDTAASIATFLRRPATFLRFLRLGQAFLVDPDRCREREGLGLRGLPGVFPPICVFITVGPLQSCVKVVSARGPPLSLTLSPSHPPSVSLLRHVQRCVREEQIIYKVNFLSFLYRS